MHLYPNDYMAIAKWSQSSILHAVKPDTTNTSWTSRCQETKLFGPQRGKGGFYVDERSLTRITARSPPLLRSFSSLSRVDNDHNVVECHTYRPVDLVGKHEEPRHCSPNGNTMADANFPSASVHLHIPCGWTYTRRRPPFVDKPAIVEEGRRAASRVLVEQ